jgi:pentose-5-phosphate-3-epimerase
MLPYNMAYSFTLQVEVLRHKHRQLDIEVDGGVGLSSIDAVAKVCVFSKN